MNEFVPFPPKPEPKPKPFPRRAEPILPQATSSPETFNRFVVAKAQSLLTGEKTSKIANQRWPGDRRLSQVINRAATEPATPANTQALGATMTFDAIRALQAVSAAAQIMSNPDSLQLVFDRYERIAIPDFIGLDEGPPPFVAPGQPAPVGQLTSQLAGLEPFKLEFIVVVSKEMMFGSNAERLVGDALRTKMAIGLDQALFDAQPADEGRPPGLRWRNLPLRESAAVDNATAMMRDIQTLVSAAENIAAAAPYFFVARPGRISAMRIMLKQVPPNFVLLPSAAGPALPESVLLCLMPTAFASAVGAPEVEIVEQAAVEMNDAPGSPDVMQGQRVHSMFQSDSVGIKVRIPASWTIRHPAAANWITCVWPSDIGGGGEGMPEAPFDEFVYGRHQSGWTPVCEEPAASPANTAYVRASYGAPGGWYPLEQFLTIYAPLISPFFGGTPRAPHPPANDASTQIATTQFVRDNAGSGGGGIEEVPAANGAYARVRSSSGATWLEFNALGVAGLNSPQFTGGPTAPSPDTGDLSDRLATAYSVARDFMPRLGGNMSGPLIAAPGTGLTNPGLAIGDNATGFYRSGTVLVLSVSGSFVQQYLPDMVQMNVPIMMGGANKITSLGDATAAQDALNLRTADARYMQAGAGGFLSTAGGSMTGTIHMVGTSGPQVDAAVAFGIRGAQIAWSESGNGLIVTKGQGNAPFDIVNNDGSNRRPIIDQALGDARYLQLAAGGMVTGPLTLYSTPVTNNDVVTKGYVDQMASPRAPAVIFDIPVHYPIAADGAWHTLWNPNFVIPRGGNSQVMVSLSCNVLDINNVGMILARVNGGPERTVFAFGFGPPSNATCGFTVNLYAAVSGNMPTISIELKVGEAAGAGQPFRVVGGNATVSDRSQICLIDLGPV
jgi:hypothetical protein